MNFKGVHFDGKAWGVDSCVLQLRGLDLDKAMQRICVRQQSTKALAALCVWLPYLYPDLMLNCFDIACSHITLQHYLSKEEAGRFKVKRDTGAWMCFDLLHIHVAHLGNDRHDRDEG